MEKNVAILLADLTGYTAMTDVHGGASAAKIVHKYMQLVDKALIGTTQVIQRVGDQVVMIADNPIDIVHTAKQLIAYAQEEHQFLSIHAGIHYGSIFMENGNLFGSTINVAARIMNLANRGQVLCSSELVKEIGENRDVSFMPSVKHRLKNIVKEVEIFELCTNLQSSLLHTDPVCRMMVNPDKAEYTYTFRDQTFHFCSTHCMNMFKSAPESFIESHNE